MSADVPAAPACMPDTDALLNGAMFNTDGHGFAIVAGELSSSSSAGMDAKALIEAFAAARRRAPRRAGAVPLPVRHPRR